MFNDRVFKPHVVKDNNIKFCQKIFVEKVVRFLLIKLCQSQYQKEQKRGKDYYYCIQHSRQ